MSSDPGERPWWTAAVAYQVYPRSFCDTSGSGEGDLAGITAHLDHLSWLGVDAVWLSPFYPSPMRDGGYDVSDYCDVDPRYGDLAAFDHLLAESHRRGLKVIVDWVPNHTSDQHPWFQSSRRDPDGPHGDWYFWRDGTPDGPMPNNWVESLTFGPTWSWDDVRGQWYLHNFYPSQPDLNWSNPAVQDAMFDTLRFWLDRGVDGFRMDVINLIGKDPALPDVDPDYVGLPQVILNDRPETHELLRRIRTLLDSYPGDRLALGEVAMLDIGSILGHLGTPQAPELHLAFNFPPMRHPWAAGPWREGIAQTERDYGAAGAWPTWVLSNHDIARHRTRYGGDERIARAAAVLLLGLRGTPFVYAGEELGLLDAEVPEDRRDDLAGRDGCRAPIPWDPTPTHGWVRDDNWLPWPPETVTHNVTTMTGDAGSIAHLYREMIALRKAHPALKSGSLELLDTDPDVVAWRRVDGDDVVVVAVNFADSPRPAPTSAATLLSSVATIGSRGETASETELAPYEARVSEV